MATIAAPTTTATLRRPSRWVLVLGVVVAWLLVHMRFSGVDTLETGPSDITTLHQKVNDFDVWIGANRNSSPVFLYFFNEIRVVIDAVVHFMQALISQPALGLPIPVIGWLGVVALVTYGSWVFGNAKVALLAGLGFTFLGLQGLWQESMDTLALTVSAVLIALLFGIPLGVWAGLSDRVNQAVTPGLDFMQTMPTFVYLAPLTLFFLIGPASAVIATLIYAMPPVVRITAHGIRTVPRTTVEAVESLGSTRFQQLTKVLLPMSKRTIVLGVNQTIMAALSMVTIAALIDAPGLGKTVLKALEIVDVGTAFNAGLALVVMAIVLDRVTTVAATRVEATTQQARGRAVRWRRPLLAIGAVVTVACVYLSRTYVWAAEFPSTVTIGGRTIDTNVGDSIANVANTITQWARDHLAGFTNGVKDFLVNTFLNPFEAVLTQTPWFVTGAAIVALALIIGGMRAAVITVVCLGLIIGTGLWFDAMTTLASTLVATVIVMVLSIVLGVWMGRSAAADRVLRPTLDAGQVMPAFVYLVPFLALFAAGRFTAIAAAVLYAAPVSTKLIADGIRGVSPTTVEAATSSGSNSWQTIWKVQLPMARSSLTLATNQGLIYVLSMVVVGGLVGAGALGFDVVAGFEQTNLYGKGLAAGVAIVLLGIMLDRISHAAAMRSGRPTGRS